MIEFRNVSRVYRRGADEVHALERVTLHISGGRFAALMGPSGSGKSTLLNLVSGLAGGERLVLGDDSGLRENQSVRVVEAR